MSFSCSIWRLPSYLVAVPSSKIPREGTVADPVWEHYGQWWGRQGYCGMTSRGRGEGQFPKEECYADKAGVSIPLSLSGDGAEQWAEDQEPTVSLKTAKWFKESTWKTQSPQRLGNESNWVVEENSLSMMMIPCSGCCPSEFGFSRTKFLIGISWVPRGSLARLQKSVRSLKSFTKMWYLHAQTHFRER